MHYRYTPNGRLLQMRYPDDRSISYTLDDYDRVITQTDANQTEQHFVYQPKDKGRLSSIKVNGSQIDFHYGEDDNGQRGQLLKRTTNAKATGVTETRFRYGVFRHMVESNSSNPKAQYGVSYHYTPRGELFKQVQKLAKPGQPPQQHTTEYRYDGMQRLTDEVHTNQTASFQKRYRYDGNNNLLAEQDHSHCGPGQSKHYSYNNLDQLVAIKVGKVITPILHDANGHLTQDHKATQYEYDDAGFLLQMQPQKQAEIRYKYWPNGLLSRRQSGESQSYFYPDHHQQVQTVVKDGQWRSLVRHGKSIVGRQTDQGLDQFFKVNESTGAVVQQAKGETQLHLHRYDAYGKPLQRNPTDDTDFTWNQELTEPENGITYLRHRFHHPQLRRFITRDNKAADNRYAYAHGDPVNYIDPTGRSAVGRYVGGGAVIGISLLGLLLAIPSAGASLGFTTTLSTNIMGGIFTGASAASGGFLIGSQALLNSGNKAAAKALTITSIALGVLAALDLTIAIAPKIIKAISEFIRNGSAIESIALDAVQMPRAAIGSATPEVNAGENAVSGAFSTSSFSLDVNRGEEFGEFMHKTWDEIEFVDAQNYLLAQKVSTQTFHNYLKFEDYVKRYFDNFTTNQKKWLYALASHFLAAKEINAENVIRLLDFLGTKNLFAHFEMQTIKNLSFMFHLEKNSEDLVTNALDQYLNGTGWLHH